MNDPVNIKIEKIISDGRGLGRYDGKVFFIKYAIPDEVVRVKKVNEKKNFSEGEIVSILKPSSLRVQPECKYFGVCGGCSFQHIDYRYHKIIKVEILKELLRMNSKINYDENIEFIESEPYHYRNKITLRVDQNGLGLVKEKSNEIVHIDSCPIVNEKINSIIRDLNRIDLFGQFINKIIIKTSLANKTLLVLYSDLTTADNISLNFQKMDVDNIILFLKNKKPLYLKGKGELVNLIFENIFYFSHSNFFQVNDSVALKLYSYLTETISKGDNFLDLYSGLGIYSIIFSPLFKKIYSIESNRSSVYFQRKNLKENKINNINVIERTIDKTFKLEDDLFFDLVILDPPREGVDGIFLKSLLEKINNQLIYISCEPATLTRDINIIKEKFFIKDIKIFDMFPQTRHFETVVIFEKF